MFNMYKSLRFCFRLLGSTTTIVVTVLTLGLSSASAQTKLRPELPPEESPPVVTGEVVAPAVPKVEARIQQTAGRLVRQAAAASRPLMMVADRGKTPMPPVAPVAPYEIAQAMAPLAMPNQAAYLPGSTIPAYQPYPAPNNSYPTGYSQPAPAAPLYAMPSYPAPQYAAPPPQYAAPQYYAAPPQYAAPQYAAPQYAPPQYAAPQYYAPPAPSYPAATPYMAASAGPTAGYFSTMAPMSPYGMAMPAMPSPYGVLQTPDGAPRLTMPVARMRSNGMMAQQQYPQPVYPQYAQPQYAQPQYAQPVQPQYAQPSPTPQMGYAQPGYAQPVYYAQPAIGYNQQVNYGQQVIANPLNAPLSVPTTKTGMPVQSTEAIALQPAGTQPGGLKSTALSRGSLTLQGVYQYQAGESTARARLTAKYPLSPRVLFGTTIDVSTGKGFSDSFRNGLNINELFLATSLAEIPSLRFTVGQLDLTSYFDRNSFAKDGTTHFFNSVFQTNEALAVAGLGTRPGLLVNWSLSDNLEAKVAAFSSSNGLSEFALNAFAGELGLRYGNAIIRGTYVTGRDSGNRDSFREAFGVDRGTVAGVKQFGLLKDDRESAYGVNAEVFFPKPKMGIFARYGRYNNIDAGLGADTYGTGISFLDVFSTDDRLGIAYGSSLTNEKLRRKLGNRKADVLEVFYDFRFMPNLRVGFSIQERRNFSEIVAGVRVKTEFDVTPKGRLFQ
jgi:hypothetical protein